MSYFLINSFAASGTASLYTAPSGTQSVTNGQTFSVNVRLSTGSSVPVTGASVYLSYPASQLQVVGESYTGSPYTTELTTSNSGGVLRMDRAAFPMVAGGDQLFAQVTFKAIATGSAAIAFTNNSIVTSGEDDSNILTQRTGVTYAISAPAATAPAAPTSPSTPAPSSGSSSGPASSPSHSSGSSAVGSSKPTPSIPAGSGAPTSAASGTTPSTAATPGDSATGLEQGVTDNPDSGASSVQITILDSQNKPVAGAAVTVDGQTAKTDKNGVARFDGVAPGKQTVAITYSGKKTAKVVQVKNAASQSSPQLFRVSLTKDKLNPALLVLPLIVLFGAGVFFLRPSGMKFAQVHATVSGPTPGQAPVIASADRPVEPAPKPGYRSLDTPGTVYAPEKPPAGVSDTKK